MDTQSLRSKPKLRFCGYNDSWRQCEIKGIASFRRGLTYSPASVCKTGVRVLRSSNICEDTFVTTSDDVFVLPLAVNIPYAHDGDILITASNGSSRLVGKHAIIRDIGVASAVHGGFMLIASTEYPDFLNASLGSAWYHSFLSINVAGGNGAIGNLNKNELEKQLINIPEPDEQIQIGVFFREIDRLITLQQRKYDRLVSIKKALLGKLFPKEGETVPEIRFKGFAGKWKTAPFGELTDRISSSSAMPTLPRVEYEDIISGEGCLNKDLRIKECIKSGIPFRIGDVLFGKLRPYLRNWLHATFEGVAVGDFWVLRPAQQHSGWLYYLIQTPSFLAVANQTTGSKMPRADWETVSENKFAFPSDIKEQARISSCLKLVDMLIPLHKTKLDKLKQLKQAFLERMFV